MIAIASALALLASLPPVTLPVRGTLAVDAAASNVRFQVAHKLHRVNGVSNAVEGRAVVKEDGTVIAMVRVPVAAFRSGDANRDVNMRDALEAGRYPFVVFKGVARLDATARAPPTGAIMSGEVDLHGVKRPVVVPLSVAVRDDGTLRVQGSFDTSLDAHGIERPSLLFVKIDDVCHIEVDLVLKEER